MASHPERRKDTHQWTPADWGIHRADELAGLSENSITQDSGNTIFHCNAAEVHAALTPTGAWQWHTEASPFHGSLRKHAQAYNFQQYRKKRDMYSVYANMPTRWTRFSPSLMSTLTRTKKSSPRQIGRRTKHLFDWMAHSHNLAKGSPRHSKLERSLCVFCGLPETQCHINTSCTHPPLVEVRNLIRRQTEELLLSLRHQALPQNRQWVLSLITHMEDHIWTDSVLGGDLWNGRWTRDGIQDLLPESVNAKISPHDYIKGLAWMRKLTGILQKGQQRLYGIRRVELLSKEAKEKYEAAISLRKKRRNQRNQTLFDIWKIQYTRPIKQKRWRLTTLPPPSAVRPQHAKLTKWIQYSRSTKSLCNPKFCPCPITPVRNRLLKVPKEKEKARTRKLRLRKLQNIILLCR